MKKAIIALGSALALNLAALAVNWRAFVETDYLRWSYKFYGSEVMSEAAFALRATHRYGMALGADDAHRLRFSLLNALLFELAWAAVIYGVITLAGRIRPIRRKK